MNNSTYRGSRAADSSTPFKVEQIVDHNKVLDTVFDFLAVFVNLVNRLALVSQLCRYAYEHTLTDGSSATFDNSKVKVRIGLLYYLRRFLCVIESICETVTDGKMQNVVMPFLCQALKILTMNLGIIFRSRDRNRSVL